MVQRGGDCSPRQSRTSPPIRSKASSTRISKRQYHQHGRTPGLSRPWPGLHHGTVNHSEKEYVRDIHHVNALESHWSLFKRAIWHPRSHLARAFLEIRFSEFSYRRNMRHSHWSMFNPFGAGFRAAAFTSKSSGQAPHHPVYRRSGSKKFLQVGRTKCQKLIISFAG